MKLSDHFSLVEMTASRAHPGIVNIPTAAQIARLVNTAHGMEQIRALLGKPIIVHSGFRCPELNHAVGGSLTSDHMQGDACDFVCPDYGSPLEVADAIWSSGIKVDQIIREGGNHEGVGGWVHCSFGARMRQMAMTARFVDGKPHYENGICA